MKPLNCDHCDYKTDNQSHMKRHIEIVHQKKKLKCDLCPHQTSTKQNLDTHIISKHIDKEFEYWGNLKCGRCNFTTKYKYHLKLHMKAKHDLEKDKCSQCEFTTSYRQQMSLHIKAKHEKIKDMKCDLCLFKTAHPKTLRRHKMSIHEKIKIKNHKCYFCPRALSNLYQLKWHIKEVHEKKEKVLRSYVPLEKVKEEDIIALKKRANKQTLVAKCAICGHVAAEEKDLTEHIMNEHVTV